MGRSNSLLGFAVLDKDAEAHHTDAARRAASSKAEEEEAKKREEEEAMAQARLREKARAERRVNSLRRRSISADPRSSSAGSSSVSPETTAAKPAAAPISVSATLSPEGVMLRPKKGLTGGDIEEFNLVLRKTDGGGLGLSLQETAAGSISTVSESRVDQNRIA